MTLPRLVVAAPASGHGKTTVATGLMAALRARGRDVAGFKVGPDFIDPGYHQLATGKPGRNLDPFLTSEQLIGPLLMHGARHPSRADIAVIEGVMGLFDGQLGANGFASTAHIATLTRSPILLVVDISHTSRTIGAIVHGIHTFQPGVEVAGVVLNKAASPRHTKEAVAAVRQAGLAVVGVLPRDAGVEAPSRHLGLVPAAERDEAAASIQRLAANVADHVDLDAVEAIAAEAVDVTWPAWNPAAVVHPPTAERPVVAVAGGRAFTFKYAETEELMVAAGLHPRPFDPLLDGALPDGTAGIYLGGGFPQVHAATLVGNEAGRQALRDAVRRGMPTVAECAGYLYLCDSLDGHPMAGVVAACAAMGPRLTLGYRSATSGAASLLGPAGMRVTGHEFHRTTTLLDASHAAPAWLLDGQADGTLGDPATTGTPTVHASYLHTHWAGHPALAQSFADHVHAFHAAARVGVRRAD